MSLGEGRSWTGQGWRAGGDGPVADERCQVLLTYCLPSPYPLCPPLPTLLTQKVSGKTVGVVGTGKIGYEFASLLKVRDAAAFMGCFQRACLRCVFRGRWCLALHSSVISLCCVILSRTPLSILEAGQCGSVVGHGGGSVTLSLALECSFTSPPSPPCPPGRASTAASWPMMSTRTRS